MPVFVRYHAPVLVEVEHGQVISVRVDDEAPLEPIDVFDTDRPSDDPARLTAAVTIAQTLDWPAWRLGV